MRDTLSPIFVTKPLPSEKEFSVVSLVVTQERYDRLLRSLSAKGFNNENSEFLAIDNRNGNSFDGYSALRGVLPGLSGRYVLFTHDDIELISDGIDELRRQLAKLEVLDPKWMLAGNAGGVFIGSGDAHFLHLDDPYGSFRLPGPDPVRVWGLDENFLVMPRHRMPLPSLDLSGFHLFATDMCLQARAAGGTSYVIPFLLRHHGKGLVDGAYPNAQEMLERKYSQLSVKGRIQTPAAALAFGWGAKLNAFLSRQGQRVYRIKAKFGRLFARLGGRSGAS